MEFNQENFEKLKSAFSYLDVDVNSDSEDFAGEFKQGFLQKFITIDSAKTNDEIAKSVFGKKANEYERNIKKRFKSMGIEFEPGVFKDEEGLDLKGDDLLDKMFSIVEQTNNSKFDELKNKAVTTSDKRVEALETTNTELKNQLDQLKESNSKLNEQVETVQTEANNKIKSFKINNQISSIKGGIKWIDNMTDIQKKGFETIVNEKYSFDLEEKEGKDILIVKDKATGKLIENPNKAGQFLEPNEVLNSIADQNGLMKKNEGTGAQPVRQTKPSNEGPKNRMIAKPII
jgi:uncharacterized protein YlxW (UPF0749 family)